MLFCLLFFLCILHDCSISQQLSGNGDFDFDTSLNIDNDLLDHLRGRIEINQALVNPHLERVPSLASFTTGGFAGGDLEILSRETDRAFDTQVLVLGTVNKLLANLCNLVLVS